MKKNFALVQQTTQHIPNPICPPSYRETVQGAYPLSHSSDRQDARPVEVLVELACFDEFIILNVFFHLLSRAHEVVVLSVHLVLSPRTSSICRGQRNVFISVPAVMFGVLFGSVCCCKLTGYTRTKLVGKLRDKVIIYSVLHWTQYDHRPCVVDCIGDKNQVRIHTKIYSLSFDLAFSFKLQRSDLLTFLSNDWFIRKNCILLSLCKKTIIIRFYIKCKEI